MLKKLLTRYLLATGVLAHVALLGALVFAPGLVQKLRYKAQAKVEHQLAEVVPAAKAAPAVTWEQARASLRKWQANTESRLGRGQIRVDGRDVGSLEEAAKRLRDGSLLEIGEGVYSTAMVTKANDIRIIGRGHVVFDKAVAQGKGTFVINGDGTTIENIECRNVNVGDGNGSCVRLQGKDLNLEHVYFHSSQQGLLTGRDPGHVSIRHSFFERLGHGGQAHGVYQGGGSLAIDRSYFLGSKNEGHEVKSRALRTTITRSVIASLTGDDSRLIDISNGGIVSITDNTLQQGPNSENWDLIGFALEKRRHKENALTVKRNVIIMEREGGNNLLHSKAQNTKLDVSDNIIVSPKKTRFADHNLEYGDREEARLPPYPEVPERPIQ